MKQQENLKQEELCFKSLAWWIEKQGLSNDIFISKNVKFGIYEIDILLYS